MSPGVTGTTFDQHSAIGDVTAAIIPAKDEESCIGNVVTSLRNAGVGLVRVVDNGSVDGTATTARKAGAELLEEPIRGYGRACWTGMRNLPSEIEWILFCDGDGSDDLSRLPAFFAAAQNADLVLGRRVRMVDGRTSLTRVQRFGNALVTTLIRAGWGFRYDDLGPFRLVRRSALEAIQMEDRTWGWTVEMQVRAIEENLRIVELPVPSLARTGGRSKISGTVRGSLEAGTLMLVTLARLFVRKWTR